MYDYDEFTKAFTLYHQRGSKDDIELFYDIESSTLWRELFSTASYFPGLKKKAIQDKYKAF